MVRKPHSRQQPLPPLQSDAATTPAPDDSLTLRPEGDRHAVVSGSDNPFEVATLVGYMPISKTDGRQVADQQRAALRAAGVNERHLYEDKTSGKQRDDRPGLTACLKALRQGDTLVVWKLDRLGRDLRHVVSTVDDLNKRGIGFKVLTGHGASIDTTSPSGKLMFGLFAALAEFDRKLIADRFRAGMAAGRAKGRPCGRRHKMTAATLQLIMAAMRQPETRVVDLAAEFGISRTTLYRHIAPDGTLRPDGRKLLSSQKTPDVVPEYILKVSHAV